MNHWFSRKSVLEKLKLCISTKSKTERIFSIRFKIRIVDQLSYLEFSRQIQVYMGVKMTNSRKQIINIIRHQESYPCRKSISWTTATTKKNNKYLIVHRTTRSCRVSKSNITNGTICRKNENSSWSLLCEGINFGCYVLQPYSLTNESPD